MFSVGAFAVIVDDAQRVLLCHRTDMDFWNLPGGGVLRGELPTDAVIRETREETGLLVEVNRLTGVYGKRARNGLVFVFCCSIVGGRLTLTDESDGIKYFTPADIPPNTLPRHIERITDALESKPTPIFRHHQAPSAREMLAQIQARPVNLIK